MANSTMAHFSLLMYKKYILGCFHTYGKQEKCVISTSCTFTIIVYPSNFI